MVSFRERSTAKNYRPVNLLSVVNKVLEKPVYNKILNFTEKCSLFSYFRPSQFITDVVTIVSDRMAKILTDSFAIRAVASDILKAFDSVWHAGFFHKLKPSGLSGQISGLIYSSLNNRRLRVVLGGKYSQEYPRVLQGLILDTTPWLLYIKDFLDDVICEIIIYLDDTTLYSKCDQTSDL